MASGFARSRFWSATKPQAGQEADSLTNSGLISKATTVLIAPEQAWPCPRLAAPRKAFLWSYPGLKASPCPRSKCWVSGGWCLRGSQWRSALPACTCAAGSGISLAGCSTQTEETRIRFSFAVNSSRVARVLTLGSLWVPQSCAVHPGRTLSGLTGPWTWFELGLESHCGPWPLQLWEAANQFQTSEWVPYFLLWVAGWPSGRNATV